MFLYMVAIDLYHLAQSLITLSKREWGGAQPYFARCIDKWLERTPLSELQYPLSEHLHNEVFS